MICFSNSFSTGETARFSRLLRSYTIDPVTLQEELVGDGRPYALGRISWLPGETPCFHATQKELDARFREHDRKALSVSNLSSEALAKDGSVLIRGSLLFVP